MFPEENLPQNHGKVWVARDFKENLIPTPCLGLGDLPLEFRGFLLLIYLGFSVISVTHTDSVYSVCLNVRQRT